MVSFPLFWYNKIVRSTNLFPMRICNWSLQTSFFIILALVQDLRTSYGMIRSCAMQTPKCGCKKIWFTICNLVVLDEKEPGRGYPKAYGLSQFQLWFVVQLSKILGINFLKHCSILKVGISGTQMLFWINYGMETHKSILKSTF